MSITFKSYFNQPALFKVYRDRDIYALETIACVQSKLIKKENKNYVIVSVPHDTMEVIRQLEQHTMKFFNKEMDIEPASTLCVKIPVKNKLTQIPICDEENFYMHRDRLDKGMKCKIGIEVSCAWNNSEKCGIYWNAKYLKLI